MQQQKIETMNVFKVFSGIALIVYAYLLLDISQPNVALIALSLSLLGYFTVVDVMDGKIKFILQNRWSWKKVNFFLPLILFEYTFFLRHSLKTSSSVFSLEQFLYLIFTIVMLVVFGIKGKIVEEKDAKVESTN